MYGGFGFPFGSLPGGFGPNSPFDSSNSGFQSNPYGPQSQQQTPYTPSNPYRSNTSNTTTPSSNSGTYTNNNSSNGNNTSSTTTNHGSYNSQFGSFGSTSGPFNSYNSPFGSSQFNNSSNPYSNSSTAASKYPSSANSSQTYTRSSTQQQQQTVPPSPRNPTGEFGHHYPQHQHYPQFPQHGMSHDYHSGMHGGHNGYNNNNGWNGQYNNNGYFNGHGHHNQFSQSMYNPHSSGYGPQQQQFGQQQFGPWGHNPHQQQQQQQQQQNRNAKPNELQPHMIPPPERNIELYRVLGLRSGATEDEIITAFKKIAFQHHPDKQSEGTEVFKKANYAKCILLDTEKRGEYDRYRKQDKQALQQWSKNQVQQFGSLNEDEYIQLAHTYQLQWAQHMERQMERQANGLPQEPAPSFPHPALSANKPAVKSLPSPAPLAQALPTSASTSDDDGHLGSPLSPSSQTRSLHDIDDEDTALPSSQSDNTIQSPISIASSTVPLKESEPINGTLPLSLGVLNTTVEKSVAPSVTPPPVNGHHITTKTEKTDKHKDHKEHNGHIVANGDSHAHSAKALNVHANGNCTRRQQQEANSKESTELSRKAAVSKRASPPVPALAAVAAK